MPVPAFDTTNVFNVFVGKKVFWKEEGKEKSGIVIGVSFVGMLTIFEAGDTIINIQYVNWNYSLWQEIIKWTTVLVIQPSPMSLTHSEGKMRL